MDTLLKEFNLYNNCVKLSTLSGYLKYIYRQGRTYAIPRGITDTRKVQQKFYVYMYMFLENSSNILVVGTLYTK